MLCPTELDRHRQNLTGHCYRMLGSVFDADDAVQETLIRAWRHREGFEDRAALGSWLYRIATNVCLDLLTQRKRRARPVEQGPAGRVGDALHQRPAEEWLEPIPDEAVIAQGADPHARLLAKERTRLAFVSALQRLPGRQRAALLLTEVVGFSAAEAAECLGLTVPALNSAIQRARATLGGLEERTAPLTEAQARLVDRYVASFEAFDLEGLTALLHEDVTLSMPPFTLWLSGPEEIRRWLVGPGAGCRGSRLVPIEACGSPAFAQYRPRPEGGWAPWGIIVLELCGDRIRGWSTFLDAERLFPRFGLAPSLDGPIDSFRAHR